MDNLENRNGKLIVKTTFKSDFKVKNCLLTSYGDIHECESMHHVETALNLLKKYDNDARTKYNKEIKYYELLKLQAAKANTESQLRRLVNSDMSIRVCLDFDKNDISYYKDKVLRKIDGLVNNLDDIYDLNVISRFENVNRNRGYDAAEYLVIYDGIIALENGYVVYNPTIRYNDELLKSLNCHQERGDDGYLIMIKNTAEWKENHAERMKESLLISHWATTGDIFHCPDGFPRDGYLRWRKRCEEVGLDPDKIRRNMRKC